jgi:hypothetical protein
MVTETASVLRQLIAVGATERPTVLSMGISHMYTQVVFVYKLTITLRASKFYSFCPCSFTCGNNTIMLEVQSNNSLYEFIFGLTDCTQHNYHTF